MHPDHASHPAPEARHDDPLHMVPSALTTELHGHIVPSYSTH